MNADWDLILDDCLQRIQRGQSLEECLGAYPEQADALAPLLRSAVRLNAVQRAEPSAQAMQAGRERMLAAQPRAATAPMLFLPPVRPLAVSFGRFSRYTERMVNNLRVLLLGKETHGMKFALRLVVLALALVMVAGTFTAAAASEAIPGDALYPVKLTVEQLKLHVMINDRDRVSYEEKLLDQRRAEIRQMIQQRRSEEIELQGVIESITPEEMVIAGLQFRMRPEAKMEGNPEVGKLVWVRARVENSGELTALQIRVQERQAAPETEPKGPNDEAPKGPNEAAPIGPNEDAPMGPNEDAPMGPPETAPCENCEEPPCGDSECTPVGTPIQDQTRLRTQAPEDKAPEDPDQGPYNNKP